MIYNRTKPLTLRSSTTQVTLKKGDEYFILAGVLHVVTKRFTMNPTLKKALNVTSADVLKVGDLVEFPFGIDKSKGRGKIVSGPHAPTPGDEFIKTKYFKIKGTSPKGTFDIETRRCKKVASSTAAATLSSKDIDALDNPAGLTDTLASAFRVALKKNMDFISKDVSKIEVSDPDEDPSMKLFLNSHSSSMDRAQVQRLASVMKDIESVAHKGDSLFSTELYIQSKGSYLLVVFP